MIWSRSARTCADSKCLWIPRTVWDFRVSHTICRRCIISISRLPFGCRAIRIQSSKQTSSGQFPPADSQPFPTAIISNGFAANETIVVPTIGTRIESNWFPSSNVYRFRPTNGSHAIVPVAALLVTKSRIQISFVRRACIGVRAEDFNSLVCVGVSRYDVWSPNNQSKLLSCFRQCKQHNDECEQQLIHCFLVIF